MSARKERERRREERVRREGETDEAARRQRLIKLASAAGFLAIAVVLVLVVISQTQTDGGDTSIEGAAEVEAELSGIPQHGLVLGHSQNDVRLVEFGDLQCPACAAAAEEMIPEVVESTIQNGEAQLEFRNFAFLGPESPLAAAAAIAAGEQGRGWHFIDLFYRNQGLENDGYVTEEFMTAIAEAAGVPDIAKWNRDRQSPRVEQQVRRETKEAEELGLGGTPSFAVVGPSTGGLEVIEVGSAADLEAAAEAAG